MTSTAPANSRSAMSHPPQHYDILVVGKAGNGKSAVCNTLLGQERFELGRSLATTTKTAQYEERQCNNMTLRVIDTPDVTNCGMNESEQKAEVVKWQHLILSKEPPLVLVTVRCDVRYTAEEYAIYQEIKKLWGPRADKSLDNNLVVAFTFSDRQDYDIKQDLKNPPPELGEVLRRAKKRYLEFTNKDGADRKLQAQKCFDLILTKGNKQTRGRSNKSCCCIL